MGLRLRLVQLVHLDGGSERGEVDDGDVRLGFGDGRLETVHRDVGCQYVEPLVLAKQRFQPVGKEIGELAEEKGGHKFTLHLTLFYPATHPASSPEDRPPEGRCQSGTQPIIFLRTSKASGDGLGYVTPENHA